MKLNELRCTSNQVLIAEKKNFAVNGRVSRKNCLFSLRCIDLFIYTVEVLFCKETTGCPEILFPICFILGRARDAR